MAGSNVRRINLGDRVRILNTPGLVGRVVELRGPLGPKFAGAGAKSVGLAAALAAVAQELDCAFVDAGTVAAAGRVDGIHLAADQRLMLGRALAARVRPLLAPRPLNSRRTR